MQRTKSRRLLKDAAPDPSPNQGVMIQRGAEQDVMSPHIVLLLRTRPLGMK